MAIYYVEPSTTWRSAPEPTIRRYDVHEHTASESSAPGSSSSNPSTPEAAAKSAEPVKAVKAFKPSELLDPFALVKRVGHVDPSKIVTLKRVKPADQKKPGEEDKPVHLPRADRLNQVPTKGNAQGLFLPDCCVFVGKYVFPSPICYYILTMNSLSIKVSPEKLEEDLTDMISAFGRCHVKIKMSQGLKKLPVGFVQFEVSATV